jgi:hypothetical protein
MLKMFLIKIKRRIKWEVNKFSNKNNNATFNINLDINDLNQKRLAFVYLDFSLKKHEFSSITHTSVNESTILLKLFIEQGFCIDVFDVFQDSKLVYEKVKNINYDYIFGFGDIYEMLSINNPNAVNIMYCTENEPIYSLTEERKRLAYYELRNGKKLPVKRSGVFYKERHFDYPDHIITFADKEPFLKYNKRIYETNPTGLINSTFNINDISKNIHNNFLWFGSSGVIHKGLDVLVEAFDLMPSNNHLYVYGLDPLDKSLLKFTNSNIHLNGKVNVSSSEFIEVVKKCNYIVLPSCSEAMSTSILTGMLHGLVPIVTKNAGMNKLNENAIYINDFNVDEIYKLLTRENKVNAEIIFRKKIEVYRYAHEHFRSEHFTGNLGAIFSKIFNNKLTEINERD